MKTLTLVLLMVLAAAVFPPSAHGDELQPFRSLKLTPQIQAMLAELRKETDLDVAAGESSANPVASLMALAATLFPQSTSGDQRQPTPVAGLTPQIQAMHTHLLRGADVDRPAEGVSSNPIALLMALVARFFPPSTGGDEVQPSPVARLTPQIRTVFTQLQKGRDVDLAPEGGADSSVASLMALATTLLSQSEHGDQAQLSQVAKLTPQIQVMFAQLLKAADVDLDDPNGAATSRRGASATSSATARDGKSPTSQALHTSSLRTGGLTTSSLDGAPRMTDEEWRQLFPTRK